MFSDLVFLLQSFLERSRTLLNIARQDVGVPLAMLVTLQHAIWALDAGSRRCSLLSTIIMVLKFRSVNCTRSRYATGLVRRTLAHFYYKRSA